MDSGSCPQCSLSVDPGAGYLYLARAGGRGRVDVPAGAAMAGPARRDVRRSFVRRESVSPCDRLLAKRVRRTAGQFVVSTVAFGIVAGRRVAGRVARRREGPARDSPSCSAALLFLVDQRTCGGNDPLFSGLAGGGARLATALAPDLADGNCTRCSWGCAH